MKQIKKYSVCLDDIFQLLFLPDASESSVRVANPFSQENK